MEQLIKLILGMCGDYDSVIGMNKENSIKKFKKDPSADSHFPANWSSFERCNRRRR